MQEGILVGCDWKQEWLLPWWWRHYSACNQFPVAFADFGMSPEGVAWCRERGIYLSLPVNNDPAIVKENLSSQTRDMWEARYGQNIWAVRSAWMKKPLVLLHAPFSRALWLDLDTQVRKSLEPIFNSLRFGADIALVRDIVPTANCMLPGEIRYNSGVIAFRQKAPFLSQFYEIAKRFQAELPGDQELLCRAIFLHAPPLLELPDCFNRHFSMSCEEDTVVRHFCDGSGKIALLQQLKPEDLHGIGIPKWDGRL